MTSLVEGIKGEAFRVMVWVHLLTGVGHRLEVFAQLGPDVVIVVDSMLEAGYPVVEMGEELEGVLDTLVGSLDGLVGTGREGEFDTMQHCMEVWVRTVSGGVGGVRRVHGER